MKIEIPVSVGELLDKISILQIKTRYTDNEYVIKELNELIKIASNCNVFNYYHLEDLLKVNSKLWDIEDRLRNLEKDNNFGEEFIELARSVYITNDERAKIKREINDSFNSEYKEVKLY